MSEEEKKENLLDKLNTAFVDFVGGAFGESGKDYILPEHELSFWIVDGMVDNISIFPEYDETRDVFIWPSRT